MGMKYAAIVCNPPPGLDGLHLGAPPTHIAVGGLTVVRIRRRRRWIPWTIATIVVLVLIVAIDDPLRDFTTNHAAIAEDAEDPALRPLVFDRPAAELIEATQRAARRIKTWEYIGTARIDNASTIVFERTGRVTRITDDIIIRVEDLGQRCRLTGESRSRIGLGDLGQNPRNLRRILTELAVVLENDALSARPAADTLSP
jgi:uncharacterized protein (DUF1499 family)